MELIKLNANARTVTGNGAARALRRAGEIPAVLYGPKTQSLLLTVNARELEKVLKEAQTAQALLKLEIDSEKGASRSAMVRELQVHPVSRDYLHVDFYEIAMDRKILVNVPVTTTGQSKGVEMGGMLQIVRRELEVLCLPTDIPEKFEIDITDMDIGDSVHVSELPVAEGVEIPYEVDFTVLTVLGMQMEPEEAEEVEEIEGIEGVEGGEAGEGAEEESSE